ncbi:hypothetical protein CRUP_008143 [Coryphaenoides rupestris]|nr:hypothetical protein CRUP_008143 [Coryphaenoides rupestris]
MDMCKEIHVYGMINDTYCRIQSGSYLSTGWFTIILAMDMCKEIHVYGMINDTYCSWSSVKLTHPRLIVKKKKKRIG